MISNYFSQSKPGSDAAGSVPIDEEACKEWVYPTNREVRNYQLQITRNALFHNTLVVLPTGLGKTLIAAVVMYNFYRWFPTGKVVFMAPTKPLVAQQIEACHNVTGAPPSHSFRAAFWHRCAPTFPRRHRDSAGAHGGAPGHRSAGGEEKALENSTSLLLHSPVHGERYPARNL
jgi:superfamily II DNA or RNA helicase